MKNNRSITLTILFFISSLYFFVLSTEICTYGMTQTPIQLPNQEIVDLEPDTQLIRDVEIVKGNINKKSPLINHVISIVTPGQLDVDVSFVATSVPDIRISGLDFTGTSGTFNVTEGDYVMSISSSSTVNFTATITYPERKIPVDIPLGAPKTIIYGKESNTLWYIYLCVTLIFFFILGYLFKTKRIRYNKNT